MKNHQENMIQNDKLDDQLCEEMECSVERVIRICKENPLWEPSKIIDQWQEENEEALENALNDKTIRDVLIYELMEDAMYFADSEKESVEQATLIVESIKLLVSKLLSLKRTE